MREPYILIIISMILAIGNYVIWWLIYDDEFDERIRNYQSAQRGQVRTMNNVFTTSMQGIIELDPEAASVLGFEDKMQGKIDEVDKLRAESETLRSRTIWVYYTSIFAVITGSLGVLSPMGVELTNTVTLYFTAVSWWGLMIGVLMIVGFLTHHQIIEMRIVPKREGEAISGDTVFQRVIESLRNLGKD